MGIFIIFKSPGEELVAQLERFGLETFGKIYRDIVPQLFLVHLLYEKPALKSLIPEVPPRRHDFRAEHVKGFYLKRPLPFGSKNRRSFLITRVQYLDDIGRRVAKTEIRFVQDEGTVEHVYDPENRRCGCRPSGEHGLVTDRTYDFEQPGFAAAVISERAKIGKLVESVVYPREQDIICRRPFKKWTNVEVSVDEFPHSPHKFARGTIIRIFGRKQHDFFRNRDGLSAGTAARFRWTFNASSYRTFVPSKMASWVWR